MKRKTLYVDTDLLEKRIADSVVKIADICDALGISRQAFAKKRKGETAFLKSEVYVLCDLLNISAADAGKIFYPKGQPQG